MDKKKKDILKSRCGRKTRASRTVIAHIYGQNAACLLYYDSMGVPYIILADKKIILDGQTYWHFDFPQTNAKGLLTWPIRTRKEWC